MALPESLVLYSNWGLGTKSGDTYTQATPEIPNELEWSTFIGTIAQRNDSPWNGQYLFDTSANWYYGATVLTSAATTYSGGVAVNIGGHDANLGVGEIIFVWLRRVIGAGASAESDVNFTVVLQGDTAA